MRRVLAIVAVIGLVQFAAGCRHVAGGCDCEHAPAAGAPAYMHGGPAVVASPAAAAPTGPAVVAPSGPAVTAPAVVAPAPMPK
jgi:hypothetical protein